MITKLKQYQEYVELYLMFLELGLIFILPYLSLENRKHAIGRLEVLKDEFSSRGLTKDFVNELSSAYFDGRKIEFKTKLKGDLK